jgi:hypothetical protein
MEEGNMMIEIGLMKRGGQGALRHVAIGHGTMNASLLIRMKRLGLGAGIGMMIGHIIDMRGRGESTRRESQVGIMIIRVNGRGVGIPTDERNYLKQRGNMKIERVGDMRKERLRIRVIGGTKTVGDMGMWGKMKSVNMGNTGTTRGHVRLVVDIETHHPRDRKMIITSVDAGPGQEQEVVVVIETIEGNELGHFLLERNEPQRLMRRKGRLRRKKKSNLPEWVTNRRVHRQYQIMDLINLSK